MATQTRTKSNGKRSPSSSTLIPKDILKETEERFRTVQRQFQRPLEKSVEQLLSQNDRSAVEKRLEIAGLSESQARTTARDIERAGNRAGASLSDVSDFDSMRIERILGVNDLVDIRFLLTGAQRSAAVGRIRLSRGFATGFLVAPEVVMTNWHVFQKKPHARDAQIEFGYHELDAGGKLTTPTTYRFDVERLFFADQQHDVALVALGKRMTGDIDAKTLPHCRLTAEMDAAIAGVRLNIIQHPAGEPKQVALRDNTVIAIPDATFLHYRSDTKRGSSGSPVFNDEWQLVGLHHSGVPKMKGKDILDVDGNIWRQGMPDDRIWWIANEAIQSSAIYRLLEFGKFKGEAKELVDRVLHAESDSAEDLTQFGANDLKPRRPARQDNRRDTRQQRLNGTVGHSTIGQGVSISIPFEVTVTLGDVVVSQGYGGAKDSLTTTTVEELLERFDIDDDYSNRNGYRSDFLDVEVPLPKLTEEQENLAAQNREPIADDEPYLLRYHNFSVVMNGERRIPFYTAVNIDGDQLIPIARDDEGGEHPWLREPRIGAHEQTSNGHYRSNRLDRGHLVRRLDPGWGATDEDSARGIVDTFHYSNCAPQYDAFNRKQDSRTGPANGLWLGLEDHVLINAAREGMKIVVFSGPVFRENDPDYKDNGLRIPLSYWKIIAWTQPGELHSAAFLLSQKDMLDRDVDIETLAEEKFDFRKRELFQSTVDHISDLTSLDFGPLHNLEQPKESENAFTRPARLTSLRDIALP